MISEGLREACRVPGSQWLEGLETSMLGEALSGSYETICSNLENESNSSDSFSCISKGIPDSRVLAFVYGDLHMASSPPQEVQKHAGKHGLDSDHLGANPSPATSLLQAFGQGTEPLKTSISLSVNEGNNSIYQTELSGELEEAICVKHLVLRMVLFLTL